MGESSALERFHPLVGEWFGERIGTPTEVQEKAWPKIANGEHVLVTAPTGSGKTLTAFLWAIDAFITGRAPLGCTGVLYISPLKALNNDIRRNLLAPLAGLKEIFERHGEPFPDIRVLTRSGDTPQEDRRRMLRRPPEILITTPESFNLLLSSRGGRSMLPTVSTVILDEIHAVLGTKRDVHLITGVERLTPLAGEFQRIGLSATVRPLEEVAEFLGGCRVEGDRYGPRCTVRPVAVIRSEVKKRYDVTVRFPRREGEQSIWDPVAEECRSIIRRNRSTLFFVNSRRLCEKITRKINEGEHRTVAYAHHGSLSRELRNEVEQKLKQGELKAIVATNSLELGIDIGALDEVVLIQSPPSVSSAVQRIGRAGHRVGEASSAVFFPTHDHDLLEAAVLAAAVPAGDIEESRAVRGPLDVLAQVIVSMTGTEVWNIDDLYGLLRSSYPYRGLPREQFDLVLAMLAGRYAGTRVRELNPRISVDRTDNTVQARKGALLALYTSGGVIPDRGYFHLRHDETGSRIGELDEEFVWETRVGQVFTLGTQNWKVRRITHNDVFVVPGNPQALAPPFWRGEGYYRDFHFSTLIGRFLEEAEYRLDDPDFLRVLEEEHRLEPAAAQNLVRYLREQREDTHSSLPHRHHLLVEYVNAGPGGAPGNQIVIHTMWGGRVNKPYALALEGAWERKFGKRPEVFPGNDCIVLVLPHEVRSDELLSLVTSGNVDRMLRGRLEGSGFFGARFRESAGRALLLSRTRMNERMPLWMSRLRSQKLQEAVSGYEDFPILLEAWRSCLQDEFDMDGLRQVLAEMEAGNISRSDAYTVLPSPFARTMSWAQVNSYVYMSDEPADSRMSRMSDTLLRDVVFSPGLRPGVPPEIVEQFERKRMRLEPGYPPDAPTELIEWVKERLLIPLDEWDELLAAMRRDGTDADGMIAGPAGEKIVVLEVEAADRPLVAPLEFASRIVAALSAGGATVGVREFGSHRGSSAVAIALPGDETEEGDPTWLLGEWLSFYGPRSEEFVRLTLGIERGVLRAGLDELLEGGGIVSGRLVREAEEDTVCDSRNFEILLRRARAEARPRFETLPATEIPFLVARVQGIVDPGQDEDALFHRIEQLECYPAPAHLWESEILPARLKSYDPSVLDSILRETDLHWLGTAKQQVTFSFDADLDLLREERPTEAPAAGDDTGLLKVFPGREGKYDFSALQRFSGLTSRELNGFLWEGVWRGEVSNDTFQALRKGILNRFSVPAAADVAEEMQAGSRRRGARSAFSRWRNTLPSAGSWYPLRKPEPNDDPLETEERRKDRARLLLDRYGILFRELTSAELPPFRWSEVFRGLRLMELSGEVLSGYFFHGIPGPQFISHQAFRLLLDQARGRGPSEKDGQPAEGVANRRPKDPVFWMNGADPASLCGSGLPGLKGVLPRRLPTTHLVFRGSDPVVISKRTGRDITFRVPPDDPRMEEYLGFLHHLLDRRFEPVRNVVVETINGGEAAGSEYADVFRTSFHVSPDYRHIVLSRLFH